MADTRRVSDEIVRQVEEDLRPGNVRGAAHDARVEVVNHDRPTDPDALRALRIQQAEDAVAAAQAKVDKQRRFVETAPDSRADRARAHLKGAEKALADAIATQQRLAK